MSSEQSHSSETRPRVDWRALHARLAAAREALERSGSPDPQVSARILKERARALARRAGQEEQRERLEVVELELGSERYAFEARHVREVLPLENLTPLPCTPAHVLGIVNVRGEILSVIDLRKFFELPDRGLSDLDRVVVLEGPDMVFGVLADSIARTRRVAVSDLQPSLPTLSGLRAAYLKGVTAERVVLLDAAKLLADERLVVREDIDV
ncbi:MAG: chemotaxis protein CheW [Betaproteobacteria bacterium]|nr:chemotaxis protein CheW [Betaproteobacteria bacterium]